MGYFPFFVDIAGKKGVIVGGGAVALRKAEKLLPFGPSLTVIAPEILPRLAELPGAALLREPFRPELLAGADFAVAATDDRALNRRIAGLCRERGVPVNAVDDQNACTFLFPALVRRGQLTVGISTAGASPAAAAWVRGQIEEAIPPNFDGILALMERIRPVVKERFSDGKSRPAALKSIFAACLAAGRPLAETEWRAILEEREARP